MKKLFTSFILCMLCAVSMYAASVPHAVFFNSSGKLLFTYAEAGTYKSGTGGVSAVYTGDYVINSGSGTPEWYNWNGNVTNIEFDPSFASARPKSTANWFGDCNKLTSIVGMKEYLNTSEVTNMSRMFYKCSSIASIDASGFDTSNVTDMSYMFSSCNSLTSLDVSSFNTSEVTNMSNMFSSCHLSSLNLSNFDTSNVTSMSAMFNSCGNLWSLDISSFNTSKVTDMSYMFANCTLLGSIDVSSFDTSNVTTMESMFFGLLFMSSLDVSNFNTSKVTNMCKMFSGSGISGLDISNFNTSEVTTMAEMFSTCTDLQKLNLSNFNTSKVTNMDKMFDYCTSLTTIYCNDNWKTGTLQSSTDMFKDCEKLKGAIAFDGSKLNADYANPLTGYFTKLIPHVIWCDGNKTLYFLADGNTYAAGDTYDKQPISRVWDDNMGFASGIITATGEKIPVWGEYCDVATTVKFEESFAYVRPTSTWEWFLNFKNLTTITGLENLNTSATRYMYCMFTSCEKMTSIDISTFDMSSVTDIMGMFGYCNKLETVNLGSLDMSGVGTVTLMFAECPELTTIYCDNAWSFTDENSKEMFDGCTKLVGASGVTYNAENITATYANPTTGYFTWTSSSALGCDDNTTFCLAAADSYKVGDQIGGKTISSVWGKVDAAGTATPRWQETLKSTVTSVVIDASFAAERPKSTAAWFENFEQITGITGLSNLNTSEVTDMRYMFSNCVNLEALDLSTFNTAKVTNMSKMFRNCNKLASLDLSNWDTSKLKDMNYMFQSCQVLPTPNLSHFNTAAVTNMSGAFVDCQAFTALDLSTFNTANVTTMKRMFDGCMATSLDLSNFDVTNVTDMEQMFRGCTALSTIFCDDTWSCNKSTEMFLNCTKLVGGNGTTCDGSNNIDVTYARLDSPEAPGYFSKKPYIPTGIDSVKGNERPAYNIYYNLSGQRVTYPTKGGIYIINGKKVVK